MKARVGPRLRDWAGAITCFILMFVGSLFVLPTWQHKGVAALTLLAPACLLCFGPERLSTIARFVGLSGVVASVIAVNNKQFTYLTMIGCAVLALAVLTLLRAVLLKVPQLEGLYTNLARWGRGR